MSIDVTSEHYAQRVYASVVGKILGVYLGRPVEGWPYARVQAQFGRITDFPAFQLGEPLIVADDDISASFLFTRVIEDDLSSVSAEGISNNWLNYIIEGKSVLWWGGLGRSTEHTALVNLKRGTRVPESGSAALNGTTLAEQIGALIFNDNFSLLYPGQPERAAEVSRLAASVSHDGAALEATAYMAAVRAELFNDSNLRTVAERSLGVVTDPRVIHVIRRVLDVTATESDWRRVRDIVDAEFGYAVMPGPCHVLSNLGIIVMALLMGDDVLECASIAASAGFDSDSNAGVVGGTAGIRFGQAGLVSAAAHRVAMADRMLVVSADGGECVTDAAREALRLTDMARFIHTGATPTWSRRPRFTFPWEGARQGFSGCPHLGDVGVEVTAGGGMRVEVTQLGTAISTPTFLEPTTSQLGFSTIASPTLVQGQTVVVHLETTGTITLTAYVVVTASDGKRIERGHEMHVSAGEPASYRWMIPDLGTGLAIRFGLDFRAFDGKADVRVTSIDWHGAPAQYELHGVLQSDIWDLYPVPLRAWVSAADNFEADYNLAIAIAQTRGRGTAATGTRDWDSYQVSGRCRPALNKAFGLIGRCRGLRRYYALRVATGEATLIRCYDGVDTVLTSQHVDLVPDEIVTLALRFHGTHISGSVGQVHLEATDHSIPSGGAGLLVEEGAFAVDNFLIATTTTERTQNNERSHWPMDQLPA